MVEKVQVETPEPVEPTVEAPAETTTETVKEEPKEKILGKFDTQEDLIKSYQELEKKNSQSKTEDKGLEIEAKAEEAVAQAGLDMTALQSEYDTNGELSKDSIDKLTSVGIDKNIIDAYAY